MKSYRMKQAKKILTKGTQTKILSKLENKLITER